MRIILTGPTGTLGKRILEGLLIDSHKVSIIGRDREKLENLVSSLKERGLSVRCVSTADLRNIELSRRALQESIACLGGIDALINSAGVWDDTSPWDLSVDRWIEVYIVNTIAPYTLSIDCLLYTSDAADE